MACGHLRTTVPKPCNLNPSPGGKPWRETDPRSGVFVGSVSSARRSRDQGEEGGEREREAVREERKPERGWEQEWGAGGAQARPVTTGESQRGSVTRCYLTEDPESRSRRNTKKSRQWLAPTRSPRPARSAPLVEHCSRLWDNFISQRPNWRRGKAAAQGPLPTLSYSLQCSQRFKSERKKRKQEVFF